MKKYGLKISGCFGDVLNSTPVLKYLSKCHGDKLDIETNFPEIFKNNPYVGVIYNPEKGEIMPHDQIFYECNNHNFGDIQKQIRKMHLTDYWSTNLGFILSPEEKTLEFYPDPLNIEIPEGKYIVINPSKTWESRTWSKKNWEKLTEMILGLGIKVIVTGQDITYGDNDKKESIEISNPNVINLVNKLNLSQLWYLVNNSLLTITMDAGLLHFAGTTDANILELGGAIDPYYRTPYRNGSQNYKHKFVGGSCKIFCQSDMKYNSDGSFKITDGFPIHGCYENKPTFECHPSPNGVFNAILELFKKIKYKQKNITHNVIEIKSQTNKLMEITKKFDKSFILYGDKNYLPIIKKTIQSIRSFSDLPIFVYLLNHHEEIDEKNVFVKKWICNIRNQNEDLFNFEDNGNFYIDRNRVAIYDILIQRPAITKDVLEKFSNVICYLDADTTCLSNLEKIFDLYPDDEVVPYFTKGVYDFMYLDGVGDAGYDLTKTLEHPTCELYNIDQSFRFQSGYRQTGYYLAGQNTIPFINEWTEMCINPIIKDNTVKYAAYHEETIVNCLLWKHKVSRGLPSVYVNGSLETIDLINDNTTFTGEPRHIKDWLLVPSKREELFFIHGEKRLNIIDNMIEKLRTGVHYKDIKIADNDYVINLPQITDKRIKLLFVTPHLSTGGMPQFLLKRIKELQKYEDEIEIFLVEFCLFSDTYIIQRNKILQYLDENHFFNLSIIGEEKEKEKKETLINIIKENNIDIIHFEEITEGFEDFNILSISLLNQIYSSDRTWKIVESCHNIWFNPTNRNFKPEAYSLVTPFHLKETFKNEPSYKELHIYPIEDLVTEIKEKHQIYNDEFTVPLIEKMSKRDQLGLDPFKTHVLNVGLWTSGKNQGEGFEIARNIWEKNKDIHFHFLGNQAPNFEDYWSPIMQNQPPNVTVWYERNDVSDFMIACDVFMFNSKWECNPLVIREAASYGMKILSRNLPQYMGMFDGYITEINDNDENLIESTSDKLLSLISSNKTYKLKEEFDFGKSLRDFYKKVLTLDYMKNKEIKNNYNVFNHYILNPYLEINGSTENELNVRFFDNDQLVYNNNININSWVKMNKQYYTNWRVEVREKDTLIYTNTNDYKGKRVFISFGSKSLGDTLSWFPYVEEFRKNHECELIVSTFLNDLFKDQYPNIEFVEPSDVVHNVVAQYNLGWYYTQKEGTESVFDNNIHKVDFKQIPLQQTASDILGLDYKEIRPKLNLPKIEKKKKVGIGIHSTAQSKYWNNPNGWQEVVNYLRELGYEVMIYSREKDGYMGNKHPKGTTKFKGGSLQEVIDDMSECEFFIGLGSGLSWLAWACKLPVVLISGFSEKWAETTLDTYRVINESVCHGCFNKENFDAGDWNWCPLHKNTDRMFECTKEISSDMVIKQIEKIINKETPEVVVVEEKIDKDFDWGWMNSDDSLSEFHKSAITEEIFNNNIYEKLFEVEKGDVVLDVGASIGPFTYSILHKKPKHVFCVEPSESEFTTLIKNTIGNPVTHINKGLSNFIGVIEHDKLFGGETHMESITFEKFIRLYGLNKIDFLKTDCEGGEYEIFKQENIPFIKENIKKIAGEWHLRSQKDKDRFRYFRDNILPQFENYEVYSIDGVDIKWDLWNDHFIEYYNEVIFYIDNRK